MSFVGFEAGAEPASRAAVAGFYAGVFGGTFEQTDLDLISGDAGAWEYWDTEDGYVPSKSQEYSLEGNFLGLNAGYNWVDASERFVVGVEADYSINKDAGLDGLATLRARAGALVGAGSTTLLYATAGLAQGKVDPLGFANRRQYYDWYEFAESSSPKNASGSVFGVGAEHWLSSKQSVKIEYRQIKLEDVQTISTDFDDHSFDWKANQLIIGYNHKF